MSEMHAMLNGELLSAHSADDDAAALAQFNRLGLFGDGLFETMFVNRRNIHLRDYHMQRLAKGLRVLQFETGLAQVESEIDALLASLKQSNSQHRLKLVISRGTGRSGYSPKGCQQQRLLVAEPFAFVQSPPASIAASKLRLASQPLLAGLKHCNRLEQVLAKIEQETSGRDDLLLCSQHGNVVEAISSNLFVLEGQTLLTPSLTDCGVAGVMRKFVMRDVAPRLGLAVSELEFPVQRLAASDGVLLTNSLQGVRLVSTCTLPAGEQVQFAGKKILRDLQAVVVESMLAAT
ncbi:MAG: aminodeoxychorismate lyase [Gammaproteobacteria bacterium]|nr:aminodeoxychorismate lyase [Gammaproteobacteria bacterium]